MAKIKVLVVDDSAFMRKMITDILEEDEEIEVIGTARDGVDGIEKIKTLHPDVVTLDVEMPNMDGLEMLKKVMETNPLPIVMLSSTTANGAENTLKAMEYGAVDFIQKPSGAISLDIHKIKKQLLTKIKTASVANIKTHRILSDNKGMSKKMEVKVVSKDAKLNEFKRKMTGKELICIGSSTGGPRALEEIISNLPDRLSCPVFIVQHMPKGFTKSMAERLNRRTKLTVKEAEDGEVVKKGTIYIAPGGMHMEIKKLGPELVIELNKKDPVKSHRPSVDRLFFSISKLKNYSKLVIILTGMGDDGSQGLSFIKQHEGENVYSIAESEETSVVFGMPRMAIKVGVDRIEPVYNIAGVIKEIFDK